MRLKAKVIIDVLQIQRVAVNSGQPKLVVLKFGFGREAENSSPRNTNVLRNATEALGFGRKKYVVIFVGECWTPEGLRLLRKTRFTRKDNIKMDPKGIGLYASGIGYRQITVTYEHGKIPLDSTRVGEFHV
jgi:hypothetical protein